MNKNIVETKIELGDPGGGWWELEDGTPTDFTQIEVQKVVWFDDESVDVEDIVIIRAIDAIHEVRLEIEWEDESYIGNEQVESLIKQAEDDVLQLLVEIRNAGEEEMI